MATYSSDQTDSTNKDTAACQTAQGICKDVVHADVCISAKVVIDPIINIGPICTNCVSKPEIIPYDDKRAPSGNCSCSFIVRQRLCVEVPIAFGTCTSADPLGMACKCVDVGPCKCEQ